MFANICQLGKIETTYSNSQCSKNHQTSCSSAILHNFKRNVCIRLYIEFIKFMSTKLQIQIQIVLVLFF